MTTHSPPLMMAGTMSLGDRWGWRLSGRPRHSSRSSRIASSTTDIFSMAFTAPPSRQCGWAISACPGRPSTVIVGDSDPRHPTHTSNAVGSVTMPASALTPWLTAARPPAPDVSSSVTVFTIRSPRRRTPASASAIAANVIAATPPFMSQAPRP